MEELALFCFFCSSLEILCHDLLPDKVEGKRGVGELNQKLEQKKKKTIKIIQILQTPNLPHQHTI